MHKKLVLSFLALGTLGFATNIVVPGVDASTEGDGNNGYPFNIGSFSIASMRYQQVYGASEFSSVSGPIIITAIDFRPDAATGNAFSSTLSSIQIDLSTTSATPSTLSTTFASNVGGNDTVVFNGALSLSSSFTGPAGGPKSFDIIITLTTPFLYDPSKGSLLMDVRNFGGGFTAQFDSDSTAAGIQRVWATAEGNTTGTILGDRGLVTQFTFTSTPEPSTLSMLGLGAVGLIAASLRRKRN